MKNRSRFPIVFISCFLIPIRAIFSSEINHSSCLNQVQGKVLFKEKGKAACLIKNKQKLLVVRKKKNQKLDLPGGKPKKDEIAQCTAYRETLEETGLQIKIGKLLKKVSYKSDLPYYIFQCWLERGFKGFNNLSVPNGGTNEISEVIWILPENINDENSSKNLNLLKKFL
jgi:8-oxo-dGTP pyrophosphatase MutT (NUDIX family)